VPTIKNGEGCSSKK